jgi:O-antigen ligase
MRESFLFCVFIGVLITFSREAMLSFFILLTGVVVARMLSFPRLIVAGAACFALFAMLDLSSTIADSDLLTKDTWSRLTLRWSDSSEKDRMNLAEKTLEQFESAPLIGQGFGTATFWADDQSHNAYLGLLADCGILGALVIPGLIFSLRRADWEFYTFASIFLVWSFFYHDVLTDFFGLIAVAVVADGYMDGYRSLQDRYSFRVIANDGSRANQGYLNPSLRMVQKADAHRKSATALHPILEVK